MVFKDPNLIDQSGGHQILNNVFESNNTDNFGTGFVSVIPRGTGILVVSNDDTLFEGNIIRDNDSFGILVIDQSAANTLVDPDPFPVLSGDPDCFNNSMRRNHLGLNGLNVQAGIPVNGDQVMALGTAGSTTKQNCFENNIGTPGELLITAFPFGNDQNDCD